MSERRFPAPAYLRGLEVELFVPHRRLPGAPPHPLYETESPRRKSLRWIHSLQKSPATSQSVAAAPAPQHRIRRVCIAGVHFPDSGVFVADSLGAAAVLPDAWRILLKNLLFACGVQIPEPGVWPEVLTPQWGVTADAGEQEARDFMSGATGCNRVPEQDCLLLFGVEAGNFLQPRTGQTCLKIEVPLTKMLEHPAAKAGVWAQLQEFRNWARQRN